MCTLSVRVTLKSARVPISHNTATLKLDAAVLLTVGSFLLTVELFYLQLTNLASLLTVGASLLIALAFLLTVGAFFTYSGKMHLIRALRDCKQRSLAVSKKAPTVSKKASPHPFYLSKKPPPRCDPPCKPGNPDAQCVWRMRVGVHKRLAGSVWGGCSEETGVFEIVKIGNGRNTVSRVLFRRDRNGTPKELVRQRF